MDDDNDRRCRRPLFPLSHKDGGLNKRHSEKLCTSPLAVSLTVSSVDEEEEEDDDNHRRCRRHRKR